MKINSSHKITLRKTEKCLQLIRITNNFTTNDHALKQILKFIYFKKNNFVE